MGYQISGAAKNAFISGKHQSATINVTLASGRTQTITERSILQGGMTIRRSSSSSDTTEIGSCIASQLRLRLENGDGTFNGFEFAGAEMDVSVSVTDDDEETIYTCKMGTFLVDTAAFKQRSVEITALDRMTKFDASLSLSTIVFPITVSALVTRCCSDCGITLATDLSALPNATYSISNRPEVTSCTYRQLLKWCAQIMGVCCYMDWDGSLRLEWYQNNYSGDGGPQIIKENRFESDIGNDWVAFVGVGVVDSLGNEHYYDGPSASTSTNGKYFVVSGNPLIQSDYDAIASGIWSSVSGGSTAFSYVPFRVTTPPMPFRWQLDVVTVLRNRPSEQGWPLTFVTTVVTDCTFVLNGRTEIECQYGDDPSSLDSASPFSDAENAEIGIRLERLRLDYLNAISAEIESLKTDDVTITGALHSSDYSEGDLYSNSGMALDFGDKIFQAPNFAIDSNGKVYASGGEIGGLVIRDNTTPVEAYNTTVSGKNSGGTSITPSASTTHTGCYSLPQVGTLTFGRMDLVSSVRTLNALRIESHASLLRTVEFTIEYYSADNVLKHTEFLFLNHVSNDISHYLEVDQAWLSDSVYIVVSADLSQTNIEVGLKTVYAGGTVSLSRNAGSVDGTQTGGIYLGTDGIGLGENIRLLPNGNFTMTGSFTNRALNAASLLGGSALPAGSDLNSTTPIQTGIYWCHNTDVANMPGGHTYGYLFSLSNSGSGLNGVQIFLAYGSTRMYWRMYINNQWYAWHAVEEAMATVTGTLASSADWGTAVAYPTGFTQSNCMIASFEVYNASMWKSGYGLTSAVDRRTFAALQSGGVNAFNNDSNLFGTSYRVLLRKL